MCDKRVVTLKKIASKPPRPVQTVTPEPAVPLQPPGGAPHLLRHRLTQTKVSANKISLSDSIRTHYLCRNIWLTIESNISVTFCETSFPSLATTLN